MKYKAYCDYDTKTENHKLGWLYFEVKPYDNGLFADLPKSVTHINLYHSPLLRYSGKKALDGTEIYEGDVVVLYNPFGFIIPKDENKQKYEITYTVKYPKNYGCFIVNLKPHLKVSINKLEILRVKDNIYANTNNIYYTK